jgi:putative DNA-invertase from lambdoid prophage Rac
MNHVAYFRVSTTDQSIESQQSSLLSSVGLAAFDKEFSDLGVSGATLANSRKGFSELKAYLRSGDTLYVSSIDRLGRDAIDIQMVVRDLLGDGVRVFVVGLGLLDALAGQIVVAVLAQVAQLERIRINERTAAGRKVAKEAFERTGRTHKGKLSLGRPLKVDPNLIAKYRSSNQASISATATYFGVSTATVKRACFKMNPVDLKKPSSRSSLA